MNGVVGGKLVRPAYLAEFAFWPPTKKRLPTPALDDSQPYFSHYIPTWLNPAVLRVQGKQQMNMERLWSDFDKKLRRRQTLYDMHVIVNITYT